MYHREPRPVRRVLHLDVVDEVSELLKIEADRVDVGMRHRLGKIDEQIHPEIITTKGVSDDEGHGIIESAVGPFSADTLPGMPEFPVTVTFIADADTFEDADLAVRLTLSAAVESYRRSSSSPDIPWTRFV